MRNLVSNAAQHGAPPIEIAVDGRADPIVIAITDHGPGIDPGLLPVIFDRFVRGDTARNSASGSSGLGLAIAFENARLHGATLEAAEIMPTSFILRLPRAPLA